MMNGGGELYMQSTMNTVLSGDSLAAARAVKLLTAAGATSRVLPEWGLRPLALRGHNVLLIGSPNYSPYAARPLQNTPFSVRYDAGRHEEVISDGRQSFSPKRNSFGELTQVYGLLTVMPGENGEKTVVFSGITSAGPQGAMEFFASPQALKDLKTALAREGHAAFPPASQVVVKCSVDRAQALTWAYEAHRVIDKPPALA